MSDAYDVLIPASDADSADFLEAVGARKFLMQKCTHCGELRFPPRLRCPNCLETDTEWIEASGRGTIYSFVVVHQRTGTPLDDDLPYVSALVDLQDGPRVLSRVIDCPSDAVSVGMPVEVCFETVAGRAEIPRVRKAS